MDITANQLYESICTEFKERGCLHNLRSLRRMMNTVIDQPLETLWNDGRLIYYTAIPAFAVPTMSKEVRRRLRDVYRVAIGVEPEWRLYSNSLIQPPERR